MTAPSGDAVGVARENELSHSRLLAEAIVKHLAHDPKAMAEIAHHANMRVDFARDAVRAECAAKVRGEYLRNADGSIITVEQGQRLDPDSAYNRAISDAIRALEAK